MKFLFFSHLVSTGLGANMQHNAGAFGGAANQACLPWFLAPINLVTLWYCVSQHVMMMFQFPVNSFQ